VKFEKTRLYNAGKEDDKEEEDSEYKKKVLNKSYYHLTFPR
jgi:hypothetical protein